jgi:hypothetical protein
MRLRYMSRVGITASAATGIVGAALFSRSNDSAATELMYSSEAQSAEDAAGHLRVPGSYEATYKYLGSWSIADEEGTGAKQIHEVMPRRELSLRTARVVVSLRWDVF